MTRRACRVDGVSSGGNGTPAESSLGAEAESNRNRKSRSRIRRGAVVFFLISSRLLDCYSDAGCLEHNRRQVS